MNSQKNEISKTIRSQKRMKTKNSKNSKISELNQCQCWTMSVSDNVRTYLMSESHNVRL